jgi:hypothetical protein
LSNIVLQFAAQNDALSRAICAFDHGWPSHVDAVMPDGRLLGARADGGVKLRTANYARFARVLRVAIPAADDVSARFYCFLNAQLDKPYDFEAIAAFAFDRDWRKLRARRRKILGRRLRGQLNVSSKLDSFFCRARNQH